jgi:hypothetical protein
MVEIIDKRQIVQENLVSFAENNDLDSSFYYDVKRD